MRRIIQVVPIVLLGFVSAACGSNGPNNSPSTPSTPTTTMALGKPPASLTGATVELSANYPTAADVFTNTVTGTVPASWPQGTLHGTRNLVQVNASFDVTGTQVTETFLMTARLGVGTFNGPVYKFTGAPAITNVTVDPHSDPAVAPTGIAFTANSISVNDSGLNVTNGAKQILDVTFSAM
jgi:hypothetical protein